MVFTNFAKGKRWRLTICGLAGLVVGLLLLDSAVVIYKGKCLFILWVAVASSASISRTEIALFNMLDEC
jgi:hypothetical protein